MISLYAIATLLTASLSVFDDKFNVDAQGVVVDEPPTNATEPLPLNGTVMVDITEADDIDIDAIPPEGVSVIITNTTAQSRIAQSVGVSTTTKLP